jgi:excisionase family DNA binding protein
VNCAVKFDELLIAAKNLRADEVPGFLGELEAVKITAMVCLMAPAPAPPADELVKIDEAARRLGVSVDYLYNWRKLKLPFAKKMGRALRFSTAGMDAWIKQKKY